MLRDLTINNNNDNGGGRKLGGVIDTIFMVVTFSWMYTRAYAQTH